MKYLFALLFSLTIISVGKAQTQFEFGFSIGANATLSRTIQSDNMTWGYYTPPFPNTWNNILRIGWGNKKNKVLIDMESGALGVQWRAKVYADKFPYDDSPSIGDSYVNYSTQTHIVAGGRQNTNLLKISLLYKHDWSEVGKFHHNTLLGVGYMKTRVQDGAGSGGTTFWDDSLGLVDHGMRLDKFEYFRNENIYLSLGYEFSYDIGKRWAINARAIYNQGLFRMIRFHTYRTYSESLTGYSEFDEQWSVTRLSYFSLNCGVSYRLDVKKKKA